MEEEKIIEDGNNELAVDQSVPVEPTAPVEPVAEPQPQPEPAPTPEEPKKKSKLPLILILLIVIALGGFAVWYFVLGGNGAKKEEQKEEPEQEEKKEEEKKEEEKKEDDKKEDETISEELLTELKTIALLGIDSNSTAFDPLLELNGSPDSLSNGLKIDLVREYARHSSIIKLLQGNEACLGGSGTCYAIQKEDVDGVLKKYGITSFDVSKLREYEDMYVFDFGGGMYNRKINHNISYIKDGDSIIITDKMDLLLPDTKEKDGEMTKEYTFKKNNDGDYYLSNVADK